jgi:hypothetical protein
MDVEMLLGACAGLLLSALLVTTREDCARWVLAQVEGPAKWTPPVSGFLTGTGVFFAIASFWLLGGAPH